MVGIQRTLGESPTRFKRSCTCREKGPRQRPHAPEARLVRRLHAGVKLRDDEWQALFDAADARDWIFPIEALAFGDRDDDLTEWVDSDEKRAELIDELPVAAVLIYRFWQEKRNAKRVIGPGSRRGASRSRARRASGCTEAP
jgi:yecA family protein